MFPFKIFLGKAQHKHIRHEMKNIIKSVTFHFTKISFVTNRESCCGFNMNFSHGGNFFNSFYLNVFCCGHVSKR